jgi:gamma-glutamyl hercynylcysteine S-oxide synthase
MTIVELLTEGLEAARRRSLDLLAPLDDDALLAQHSPLMSPLIWDLAHIGNYEDLWLIRSLGAPAVRPEIDELYDAFLQPRARRPELPLLKPAEARDYVSRVRDRTLQILATADLAGADRLVRDGYVHRMVIQHEHQHDETMLATLQLSGLMVEHETPPVELQGWQSAGAVGVPGGVFVMGTSTDPWALDNEQPAHPVELAAYEIDRRPVDNETWARFVAEGGYHRQELWSEAGWSWRNEAALEAPLFWELQGTRWTRHRLGFREEVRPDEAVAHVCFFEAEAFANWVGRRLPTEAEWERADQLGLLEGKGQVWEWTSSAFEPYPGFAAFPYREYSEVFFGDDYRVLRGSSWATHSSVARPTFRDWDYPIRRQIFSGLRTAGT